ncbi:hypothetical protein A9G39_03245 [Gilliamella sp. Imp1-6]|nr:hypothetical protein A9G39_03245 [Gilliamella apicola]
MVEMFFPLRLFLHPGNTIGLNELIQAPYNYLKDDDGDGDNGATATGSLSMTITNKYGDLVNRADPIDICKLPYKITLSTTGGSLTTEYGVPNSTSFSAGTVSYYISLPLSPTICAVRPNLAQGSSNFAGPSRVWDPNKGFLTQAQSPFYDFNFPSTGADGLYFDLDINEIDASQLTWSPVSKGGVTATVRLVKPNNSDNWISDKSKYVTRVTLNGPRASSSQINSSNPGLLTGPSFTPQTFELEGRNSRGQVVVKYGFVLWKWFVNRGDKDDTLSNQSSWCRSIGYRLSQVRDLTNATCAGQNSGNWCQGAIGATPSSSNNFYQRQIGAGLFTEWGYISRYTGPNFADFHYWTSDASGNDQFIVLSSLGTVSGGEPNDNFYAVCVTP